MSKKREAEIRRRIKAIDRSVNALKKGAAKLTKDYARAGDFLAMQQVVHEMRLRVEEALRVRADLRQLLPPFMEDRDGVLWRHPVTPENKHFLWE